MSQELNHDGSITVIGYSLPEFCFELCDLAAKGFTVTMEGSKCPTGGFSSYYSAILVPRHHYRIDLQGNHLNVTETSTETALNEPTSSVDGAKTTSTEQPVKQTSTRTKKAT